MILVVRCVLSIALLYGAYLETGPFTVTCLGLIMLAIEIISYAYKPSSP